MVIKKCIQLSFSSFYVVEKIVHVIKKVLLYFASVHSIVQCLYN